MKATTRAYLRALIHFARWKLVSALALMVVFSMTEGAGFALLLPTLQLAGLNLEHQGEAGRYAQMVSSGFRAIGIPPSLLALLAVFVFLVGARALVGMTQNVAMFRIQRGFESHLRLRLYRAISNASWLFLCRSRSSDFAHALTSEIDRVGDSSFALLLMTGDLVIGLLYVAIALLISVKMTLLVLACAGLLTFLFRGRSRAIEESGAAFSDTTKLLFAATIEHLQGLKAAKTYGAEARDIKIFSDLSGHLADASVRAARQQAVASSIFELGSVAILAVVLFVSIRALSVPPAAILILLLLFARVMPRIMSGQQHYRSFINAVPSFINVSDIQARCEQASEPPLPAHGRLAFEHELAAEHVSFSYGNGRAPAVRDLSLKIPAGKTVALVGPSGAGKSTIADILMGLIAPDSGAMRLDDVVLGPETAREWRNQIGYVAPDTFLFHDTIRANLEWARPGATEAEMLEALRQAAAHELVAGMGRGLDTVVGDRGILVSQGERQRLALARAFLRRPAMLILDEATNSLDSDNEARVLEAIDRRRGELTVVMIAHRLSTIRYADLIYVIEDGTVVESGDWATLSNRRDGRFRALWEAQSLSA